MNILLYLQNYDIDTITDLTPAGLFGTISRWWWPGINQMIESVPLVMPILLTVSDAVCNCFGLYTKYIPSGIFMCKILDYHQNCTSSENSKSKCTDTYSFVGDRYKGVFPYTKLVRDEPPSHKKARRGGSKHKKRRRSKTKTKKRAR